MTGPGPGRQPASTPPPADPGPAGPAARAAAPATQAARVLLQALAELGVREVVLAPGSRSAPLAYAVAEAARRDAGRDPGAPRLDLHVRIDERCAAFLALGMARALRATGGSRPVAVVTTSGTAVANLHPAVLEADHSNLPLLLITADRPHELRGTGANQTTEQVGVLAPAVRLTFDVPAATGRAGEDRDHRYLAVRAVTAAMGSRTGDPGPVHLNIALREPLVPGGEPWPPPSRAGLSRVRGRVPAAPGGPHEPVRPVWAGDTAAGVPDDPARTVVVAGDGAGPVARRVAEANGWPLLAEPSSGARGGPNAVPAYRLLLAEPTLGAAVQRVVVLGRPTLSRPVAALLARADVECLVVAPDGATWPDAARSATQVLSEVPAELLAPAPGARSPGSDGWLLAWQQAGARAAEAVARVLADDRASRGVSGPAVADRIAAAPAALTGPAVVAAVAEASGPGDVLVVGSSNPVRDLDLVATWAEPPLVLANRGLAGIDGTVSTAAGAALALGRPVRAVLGDLTFLHDVGGLLVGPLERAPDLQLVVLNDDGGSIFATLEHGEPGRSDVFERVFATPHGADLGAVARGLGAGHVLVEDLAGLRAALAGPVDGLSVVEVRVDRVGRRALHERLAQGVRAAVATG